MNTLTPSLVVLCTDKPISITPIQKWFPDQCDDIHIVCAANVAGGYKEHFSNVHLVDDYANDAAFDTVTANAIETSTQPVGHLCYLVERDVERCGRLRDRFGLPGLGYDAAIIYRDKYLMKCQVRDAVPTPRFSRIENAADATSFAKYIGFPFIVKPLNSFGSNGVRFVREAIELDTLVFPLLGEEVIAGEMYHIDGFMRNGKPVLLSCSQYHRGCMAFAAGDALLSGQLDADSDLRGQLERFAAATIAALPETPMCMFHLEVFRQPDGRLVFCEIAARMGGGHIYQVLNRTFGTDVVHAWLSEQMGRSVVNDLSACTTQRFGFMLLPPRKGVLLSVESIAFPDGVLEVNLPQNLPQSFVSAQTSMDRIASCVVAGQTRTDVLSRLLECENIIRNALVWKDL